MLEFRDIDISDKERINCALRKSDFMGCEYSFANNLAWKRLGGSKISFYKDFYICCSFQTSDDVPNFIIPSGDGSYKDVIEEMKSFSDAYGKPLRITGVTQKSIPLFEELFKDQYIIEFDRDGSDYIYNASDLISLPGKKYHSKRNHLARFKELDFTYSPITEKDYDDCITFSTLAYNSKTDSADQSFVAEQFAINTFFNYYNDLGLQGGIIRVEGQTAAFTIGEKLNSDTFCVHIEKADTSFKGIYAGINNCFISEAASDFKYVNREEDMGLDGLRKAKLSYHPAFLLNKYIVTFK